MAPFARQFSSEHGKAPSENYVTYEEEPSEAPYVPMADERASIQKKLQRKKMILSIVIPFILLQILFLCVHSYIYGAVFRSTAARVHNLKVLAVDYDGNDIGASFQGAYGTHKGDSFPGLEWKTPDEYPTRDDIWQAVCKGEYWAGVYTLSNASSRLAVALANNGTDESGVAYNPTQAIQYIWNEARYPDSAVADLQGSMENLIESTRLVWNHFKGAALMLKTPPNNEAAAEVLLNPIQSFNINTAPSPQSVRIFYNTASQMIAIAMQVFFVIAMMTIAEAWNLDSQLSIVQNGLLRGGLSLLYTFIGGMCVASLIYGFRESFVLGGPQFAQLWLALWLYMHVNYLVFDVVMTFIPLAFVGFFGLFWTVFNVTSTIIPFELSPNFYHWAYVLPTYQIYQVEVQILAKGCDKDLKAALPLLFAWWIIFLGLATYGLVYRHNNALMAERMAFGETDEKDMGNSANDTPTDRRHSTVSLVWETNDVSDNGFTPR